MFGLGFGELVVIFLIALIFIGPKKLPELAKGLGKGIRDFQNAAKGLGDDIQNESEVAKKIAASQQEEIPSSDSSGENKDSKQS
jgi:TatA/E family protein of Tat protein translocase